MLFLFGNCCSNKPKNIPNYFPNTTTDKLVFVHLFKALFFAQKLNSQQRKVDFNG